MAKQYVLGFYFSEDKKRVALIKKTKPDWQAGKLNGIGGKIEEGEAPHEAMIREFREETGHIHNEWRYFALMKNSNFDVFCYVAFGDLEALQTTTEEEVVTLWVDSLYRGEVLPNIKWLVAMALDSGFMPVTIDYMEHDKYVEKQ